MTVVDIIDYRPEHLETITLKDCHDGERPAEIRGNAITFMRGDRPLAIFGWYFICPGVAQVWALISTEIYKHSKSFHKQVKLFIEYGFATLGLRRMQISVRAGFLEGWKWARALGFNCEGIMKGYGPGGIDCWLFAQVKHERN